MRGKLQCQRRGWSSQRRRERESLTGRVFRGPPRRANNTKLRKSEATSCKTLACAPSENKSPERRFQQHQCICTTPSRGGEAVVNNFTNAPKDPRWVHAHTSAPPKRDQKKLNSANNSNTAIRIHSSPSHRDPHSHHRDKEHDMLSPAAA